MLAVIKSYCYLLPGYNLTKVWPTIKPRVTAWPELPVLILTPHRHLHEETNCQSTQTLCSTNHYRVATLLGFRTLTVLYNFWLTCSHFSRSFCFPSNQGVANIWIQKELTGCKEVYTCLHFLPFKNLKIAMCHALLHVDRISALRKRH